MLFIFKSTTITFYQATCGQFFSKSDSIILACVENGYLLMPVIITIQPWYRRICKQMAWSVTLQWHHNEHDGVSDHQPCDCLLNRLFRRRPKKPWDLLVTGLCAENSPVTGEFPTQRASNAENGSTWWRHHEKVRLRPGDSYMHRSTSYHWFR